MPALLLAALVASLAQTIVIAALPTLGRELGSSTTAVTWVLTAFMLSSAVATPIAGRLGDMYGHRRVLLACLGCFAIGTVVCALAVDARSLGALVAGRALQGVAGGVFPLAFGVVRATVPAPRVPGVVALLSAMFGIGGSAGMVAAGPMVDGPGTTWLFWGLLLLAGAALAAATRLPAGRSVRAGRVDLPGAVLLSGSLVCLLLAISQGGIWGWASASVAGLFAGGSLLLAAFVLVELRTENPLVDLRLMRRRALATTNLTALVVGAAMFGVITLIPRFVQTPAASGYGFGASPTAAGLVMVPVALAMLIATPVAARLAPRVGLQAGAVFAIAAFILLTTAHTHLWEFHVAGFVLGAAYGLAFASIGNLVVEAAPPHQTGVATGVNTVARTLGGAVGAQIAAAILAAHPGGATLVPAEPGYVDGFVAFAVLAAVALAAAITVPGRKERRPVTVAP